MQQAQVLLGTEVLGEQSKGVKERCTMDFPSNSRRHSLVVLPDDMRSDGSVAKESGHPHPLGVQGTTAFNSKTVCKQASDNDDHHSKSSLPATALVKKVNVSALEPRQTELRNAELTVEPTKMLQAAGPAMPLLWSQGGIQQQMRESQATAQYTPA